MIANAIVYSAQESDFIDYSQAIRSNDPKETSSRHLMNRFSALKTLPSNPKSSTRQCRLCYPIIRFPEEISAWA
jgi:hypothetical protein